MKEFIGREEMDSLVRTTDIFKFHLTKSEYEQIMGVYSDVTRKIAKKCKDDEDNSVAGITCGIEKLRLIEIDNTTARPSNNRELMEKVNEIISKLDVMAQAK